MVIITNCSHIVTRLPTTMCVMVPVDYKEKNSKKTLVYTNKKVGPRFFHYGL
jgi:hypothetical protein